MKEIHIRTPDHPESNGRKPQPGESVWSFTFLSESGEKVSVHMGKEGWEKHSQHVLDMLTEAPSYTDGSLK